jgi:hypothetical protein
MFKFMPAGWIFILELKFHGNNLCLVAEFGLKFKYQKFPQLDFDLYACGHARTWADATSLSGVTLHKIQLKFILVQPIR